MCVYLTADIEEEVACLVRAKKECNKRKCAKQGKISKYNNGKKIRRERKIIQEKRTHLHGKLAEKQAIFFWI